jgi:hypothetical protein
MFRPEDGDSMFLQNAGIYLKVHTALQPRRPTSTRDISGSHGGESEEECSGTLCCAVS